MHTQRLVIPARSTVIIMLSWGLCQAAPGCTSEPSTAAATVAPSSVGCQDTLTVIHRRSSVRSYTDQPVAPALLDQLVRAGMAAPTAGNKRPWEFVVVSDRTALSSLANVLTWGKMLNEAQAAIVVVGQPEQSFRGVESSYWVQDTSAATENILLAAEALGLGAVWLGVFPVEERVQAIRVALDIPAEAVPLNVISIGYPKGPHPAKDKYDASKIHRNSW